MRSGAAGLEPATPGFGDPSRFGSATRLIRGERQSVRPSAVYRPPTPSAAGDGSCRSTALAGQAKELVVVGSVEPVPARAIDCPHPQLLSGLYPYASSRWLRTSRPCGGCRRTSSACGSRRGCPTRSARTRVASEPPRTLPPAEHRLFTQKSMLRRPSSLTGLWIETAAIWMRPLARNTRKISEKTASLSGTRSITPFEITTPKLSSSNGSRSISPPTKSTLAAPGDVAAPCTDRDTPRRRWLNHRACNAEPPGSRCDFVGRASRSA